MFVPRSGQRRRPNRKLADLKGSEAVYLEMDSVCSLNVSIGSSPCENVGEPTMHRIVFSIFLSRQKSPVQFVSASTKLRQMFCRQTERRSFHTAWVRNGPAALELRCPLYPHEQTSSGHPGMSVSCHEQTSPMQVAPKKKRPEGGSSIATR